MRDWNSVLEQRKGQLMQVETTLDTLHEKFMALQIEQKDCEKAQVIIQKVAQLTQESLNYHISELVTLALAAVFDDPYEFEALFKTSEKSGTVCELWFKQDDGERIHPLSASGGGAVDVAAFALRVALWSLKSQRTRPVMILDEPLRFLSKEYQSKASAMLKDISKRLGIQIIMVTHSEELIECADRVFTVTKKKGVSRVTTR